MQLAQNYFTWLSAETIWVKQHQIHQILIRLLKYRLPVHFIFDSWPRVYNTYTSTYISIVLILVFQGVSRTSSFSTFNCGSICEHFLLGCELPQKCWARSVQPFWRLIIGYKQIHNTQTDQEIIYIYYCFKSGQNSLSENNHLKY